MGINLGALSARSSRPGSARTRTGAWLRRLRRRHAARRWCSSSDTSKYLGDAGPAAGRPAGERKRTLDRWSSAIVVLALIGAVGAVRSARHVLPMSAAGAAACSSAQVALAVAFFGYVLFFARPRRSPERKRVGVIIVLLPVRRAVLGRLRAAGALVQPVRARLHRSLVLRQLFDEGMHPAACYQAVNPVFIIIFAPVFAWIWVSLGARNLDPSAPVKLGFGLHPAGRRLPRHGAGAAQLVVSTGGKVGPTWLMLTYLFHTFGELCLSPVGLSSSPSSRRRASSAT